MNSIKVTEEKDVAIALLYDDLQNCEYDNVPLQAQKDVYQAQVRDPISIAMFLMQKIQVKTTLL